MALSRDDGRSFPEGTRRREIVCRAGGRIAIMARLDNPLNKQKPQVVKAGRVEKIITSPDPEEPEKAQITVHDADHLYRELRIPNTLEDANGHKVKLKKGAEVDVVIEADENATVPKNNGDGKREPREEKDKS